MIRCVEDSGKRKSTPEHVCNRISQAPKLHTKLVEFSVRLYSQPEFHPALEPGEGPKILREGVALVKIQSRTDCRKLSCCCLRVFLFCFLLGFVLLFDFFWGGGGLNSPAHPPSKAKPCKHQCFARNAGTEHYLPNHSALQTLCH